MPFLTKLLLMISSLRSKGLSRPRVLLVFAILTALAFVLAGCANGLPFGNRTTYNISCPEYDPGNSRKRMWELPRWNDPRGSTGEYAPDLGNPKKAYTTYEKSGPPAATSRAAFAVGGGSAIRKVGGAVPGIGGSHHDHL